MLKINSAMIRDYVFRHGLSLKEFAKQTGLNAVTVKRIISDGATASMKTIGTLAKFFNVSGDELILKA